MKTKQPQPPRRDTRRARTPETQDFYHLIDREFDRVDDVKDLLR